MIKLVVSDIDGTLLRSGEKELKKEVIEIIGELKKKGVLFAAASGRPYADVRHLFKDAEKDMAFLASDGALVSYRSEIIGKFPIDRETGFALMKEIYMETEAEVALYGAYMAYSIPKEKSFASYFRKTMNNHAEEVDCMRKVPEEYLKIGIFHKEDVEKYAGAVASYWNGKLHRVYSSMNWIEYTNAGVHKGAALDKLMRAFGIAPDEVLAFGDNKNDKEMLALAGCSYAIGHADREIKELCGYETENPIETIKVLFGL